MKKITIMAALVVAAATSFGAISINWSCFGFMSGADNTKYATAEGQGVKLVWDLVYTTGSSITAPTYDEGSGAVVYSSTDTVLSERTWSKGSTDMIVEDKVVSDTKSSSPLTWSEEYATIAKGAQTYKNFTDTKDSGGIYAAIFQYMDDGTIYFDVTDLYTDINWTADPKGSSNKVIFGTGKATYNISQTLYQHQAVPEPATMGLLGLGALGMVLRRKLRK